MYGHSLTDGLLNRRTRRRKRRWKAWMTAVVLAGGAWIVFFRGIGRGDEEHPSQVQTDQLYSLTAPEIRGPGAMMPLDGSGAGVDVAPVRTVIPSYVEGEIQPNQTVFAALESRGVPRDSINPVVRAINEIFDFRYAQPGHSFQASLDDEGIITVFRYQTSPERIYEARLVDDGTYQAQIAEIPLEVEVHALAGTIETSLYAAIAAAGEESGLGQAMVDIFQWDIDFSSDVRPGDAFRMLYEKVYLDGAFLRYGNILAVEFRGARASMTAYYFSEEGHEGYYMEDGRPVERMFLAAPCRYRRISSRFDPHRMHPVLNVRRPHLGVDYAASTGTPVWAVADGEVTHVGERGANGNLVTIEHAHGYESGYAHLNGYARGLREGQQVRQGQVIGYVGSTGLSTGPHLHFGLKLHGDYIDPLADEHEQRGPSLEGRALRDFQRRQSQLRTELDEIVIADVSRIEDVPDDEEDDEALEPWDGDSDHGF